MPPDTRKICRSPTESYFERYTVSNADLTVGLYIYVEDPIVTTTPTS